LALKVGVSVKSARVRQILEKVWACNGKPEIIRSDNGSEFIGKAVGSWLEKNGVKPLFIEPGKPWQNGKGESLERKTS
jgi:transposase InsO family protein